MDETLLRWDVRPEFDPEAKELANAMKMEAILQSAIMGEPDGNGL